MSFLEELKSKILIGDGAMGTLLYSNQIDRCFEELNLSHRQQIIDIHQAYVNAGADVIQTNTYAGNAIKLARYGLEHLVDDINKEAIKLAKEAVGSNAYILGTIGGIRGVQKAATPLKEIEESFQQQLASLLNEGIDGILLETYYDVEELKAVVELARKETNVPIIAQLSLYEVGVLQNGIALSSAFDSIIDSGADVVGLNCRMGPFHMIRSLEQVPIPEGAFLSAYPNASLPDYRDGRFVYQSNPSYFGESALRFREQGVRLIGGCCGTTPEHIKAMADAVKGLAPIEEKMIKQPQSEQEIITVNEQKEQPLHEIAKERLSVIVELDPPKTLDTTKFIKGAKYLTEAGVDAVTMADNSLASPRISNMALGSIIKNQLDARPLVHVTCRDRNLIGLQSHLLGLHTLGIDQLLAVTGDPTKVGDFPGATSVYDLSSFDLIQLMKQMNEGVSFSGKSLGQKTSFSVAAAFNPNVRHLDRAVKRLEKKIECGADYFMSQPVYSEQQIIDIYEATKGLKVPIYLGIMPLTSTRNAEFLHNEVPGIKLTDDIREAMARCGDDREKAEQEGLAIAKSLIDVAYEYFKGIYMITPFFRYEMTVELTKYVKEKEKAKSRVIH